MDGLGTTAHIDLGPPCILAVKWTPNPQPDKAHLNRCLWEHGNCVFIMVLQKTQKMWACLSKIKILSTSGRELIFYNNNPIPIVINTPNKGHMNTSGIRLSRG
jgi:hypothetical protein